MKATLALMFGLLMAVVLATSGLNPGLRNAGAQMPDTTGWNRPDSTTRPRPDTSGTQIPDSTNAESMPSDDREFLQTAADDGAGEVALSSLAAERASRREVRDFAQMLASDHEKANRELAQLATEKNLTVAGKPNADQAVLLDQLMKASGSGFDRAYLQGMVMDHKKSIALFERQASSGRDTDLKRWASKMLPMLRDHLARANKLSG